MHRRCAARNKPQQHRPSQGRTRDSSTTDGLRCVNQLHLHTIIAVDREVPVPGAGARHLEFRDKDAVQ